jgi:hypothetical protein
LVDASAAVAVAKARERRAGGQNSVGDRGPHTPRKFFVIF